MKQKLLSAVMFVALGLGMTSCKSAFFQVYEVESDNLKQQVNSLVFENEDCKLFYNLWSNNGKVTFTMLNKTDKDIFVNLSQSFFVKNGFAIDYFQGRTYTSQVFVQNTYVSTTLSATGKASGLWGDNVYDFSKDVLVKSNKAVKGIAQSVSTEEKEIVCIPAKCYKVFSYYSVNPSRLIVCDNSKDYPRQSAAIAFYSKDTSPVSFKNRIAYGFNKSEVAEKHVDNNFWITSVTNYSRKAATDKVKASSGCDKGSKRKVFKIGGPNKFYAVFKDEFRAQIR